MKGCDYMELRRDFEDALSEIDFKRYDPYSRPFMRALFIGQMMAAAGSVCDARDVEEELEGAEKYRRLFLETGDTAYRDMAGDELRHAGVLIKKRLAKADGAERDSLNGYERERQEMLKMVSPAKAEV